MHSFDQELKHLNLSHEPFSKLKGEKLFRLSAKSSMGGNILLWAMAFMSSSSVVRVQSFLV